MNSLIFNCNLEKLQKIKRVKHRLAAKEVVRAICKADFQNYGLCLRDEQSDALFTYTYVEDPKDGMFLMEVENMAMGYCLLVLIDTKTDPDFITIKNLDVFNAEEIYQVSRVLEYAINKAASENGWKLYLTQNKLDVVMYEDEFIRARNHIRKYEEKRAGLTKNTRKQKTFKDYILVEYKDEVLKLAHELCDEETSAIRVMGVQKAMIDTDLLGKKSKVPHRVFQKEFGYSEGRSSASYSEYLGAKSYVVENGDFYGHCRNRFTELKEKYNKK